jgi:hypothetical protein
VETVREDIEKTTTVHDQKIEVASPRTLKANDEYDWEISVNLPQSALPTYLGVTARHEWKLLAGLDVPGNDPDSGWVTIELT